MSRQQLKLEYNSFVKGLITEAGPLTFPDNASIYEQNFVLNKDGSRKRRLGMDKEPSSTEYTSNDSRSKEGMVTQAYVWKNVSGNYSKSFYVIQIGADLYFYDSASTPISSSLLLIQSGIVDPYDYASFATVNGMLVVANGSYDLRVFKYDTSGFTITPYRLKVRDFYGMEMYVASVDIDLRQGNNVYRRLFTNQMPKELDYNLRNQSFGVPRRSATSTSAIDPLDHFYNEVGFWPSFADSVNTALYADPQNTENRLVERFYPKDLRDNPPVTGHAANGHFIIDALARGASREEAYSQMISSYPVLTNRLVPYKQDYTTKGAKVVKEFAGRVFYSGFSDDVVDGDKHSPRMGSFVLFSRLVKSEADLGNCYQEADPTSPDMADIVATDGGYIRIEGAYNIQAMEVLGKSLVVFAQNGVWSISGGSDYGFDATNYMVNKIAEHGIIGSKTVVNADGTLLFWAPSGIFAIQQGETGGLSATNISAATIQTYYDNIPITDKYNCKAVFDSYRRQVRWLYSTDMVSTAASKELVFDIGLGAFYPVIIGISQGIKAVAPFTTPPFVEGSDTEKVYVNGGVVTTTGTDVTITRSVLKPTLSETKYLAITSATATQVKFVFSYYYDQEFKDWKRMNGTGEDAKAYMITGYSTLKESQREKTTPYITFYFNKSETGFSEDVNGDLFPVNPSSCLVQSQWEWTNSAESNRWSRAFQAYRHKRLYFPTSASDEFDDGNSVVVTKNKLRGYGKALSLKLETEPAKDCQILGWSQVVTVESDV